jgi:hypothetical protein
LTGHSEEQKSMALKSIEEFPYDVRNPANGERPYVNGKKLYARILIRRKA